MDGGITSGAGIYNLGKNVTVTAQANNGFEFTNWTENGTVVSTDANYTFTINENRELVANFTEINNSVLFDGVNGRIRVLDSNAPNPTAFQINGTAISVEAWVFPMDYPRADLGNTIVARTLNTNYSEPWTSYRLWINHSNGVSLPAFSISNGIPGNTVTVQAPDDIPSFQWVHLAATYDGLVMRLYVNGELKAQVNTSISINSANGIGFYIGRFLYDGFLGVIDDVRLWNIARSESDIISNMNKVLHGNEYGLAGYWNVDIKSLINGQYLAFDKTQNHNDLIFQSNTPIIPFIPLKTYESPTFNINPLSINIGTLEQGSTSPSSILTITNTGNSPLIGILSLESSNINLLGNIVFFAEGGQAIDIGISITPQISGQINESLTMRSNTATSSFINISGTSVPLGLFDVNNLSMWVQRNGIFAYNPMIESSGLEWPKGSGKTAVYSSGIWIGAIVDGDIRTSSSYYRSEFAPGPIINGIPSDPNDFTYRVYKIQNGDNAGNNPDYASWPSNLGAPVNSDGSPKIIGDQTLFAVYNDLNPANRFLGSTPLGVEVQQTIFGFNQSGTLSNTVFLRFKIINRSPKTWTNTFISIWNDADLGDAGDDLTAVDTSRNLGFIYNGSDNDQVYGVSPPAAGYKILKGAFFTKPIQGFSYFTQSVPKDPNNSTQIYNVMKGFMIDGTPYIDPLTQTSTKFPLSGDPVSSQGWLDPTPHDKRFLLTTGPFNLEPGQSKEIYAAIVLAQGSSNLNSVTVLKSASDEIQNLFNTGQIFGGALENVSSINVPEGITDSLNDISNSGAVITVTGGSSGNLVEIASYIDSPPGVQTISSPIISGVGKYIVVDIQGEVSWPIPIRIYYTRNDLLQAGIVESDLQGIYYWQGSTNLWLLYSNSGSDDQGRGPSTTWVDTTNATINSVHYEGYVAANAYHLAQLIIGAKKKTISERYTGTSAFIQALPDNAFKNPADTRRKQLIKMLEQSKSKYNSGNLKNAAQYLEQNVLNHLTSNNKSGNDLWVTDATACKTLIRMINELIDLLNRPQLLGKMIESELNVLDHIEIPTKYELSQNYPNPFNPITKIRFALPFDCYTKLTIYDILGREMETIINDNLSAGYHEVNFNGFYLPSGVYIYKLQAGEFISIKKMLLLK